MQMEVEGVAIGSLFGNDKDQLFSRHPPQLTYRPRNILNMLQDVRTNNGIERLVRKWQFFDIGLQKMYCGALNW